MKTGIILSAALFVAAPLCAQSTWTGGGDNQLWSDAANWSGGVPTSSSAVIIGLNPADGLMAADSSGLGTTIASLTYTNSLSTPVTLTVLSAGDALQVNGAITNNGTASHVFDIALTAGASATWAGPFTYSNIVNFGANSITLSGAHAFSGSNVNFSITSLSAYGRLLGSFTSTFTGTININGTYTGSAGDSFDFTTGNFSGATLGLLPTLSGGLVWNTSNFLTQGILTVSAVPEPATYAVLLGLAVLGFGAVRRRRKA